MKAWKILVPVALGGLALGGFYIAKRQTNGGKGSGGGSEPAVAHHAAEIETRNGSFIGTIYVDGAPTMTLGPRATKAEVATLIRDHMVKDGAAVFYVLTSSPDGAYYFEGWKDGSRVLEEQGPYASLTAAMAAGSTWATEQAGAAVGGPGCPSCAGVGARGMRARAWRRRSPGPGEVAVDAFGKSYKRTRGGRSL